MKMLLNEEFNGVELYFDTKPTKDIIEALKGHKFRWHNLKKCWYAKQNDDTMELANTLNNGGKIETATKTVTEKTNEFGVKVGDIFEISWGWEQTNVDFLRVKELRGKNQVVVQEVDLKMTSNDGISGMSADRTYDPKDYTLKTGYTCFVKDNINGKIKKISGNKDYYYLSFDMGLATPYHGGKVYESWYA